MSPSSPPKIRRDGWTAERQLRFLDVLARTGSVTRAAAAAGMSRESAYRLRNRASAVSFAAAWDRLLAAPVRRPSRPSAVGAREGSGSVRFGSAWLAQETTLLCGNAAEGHKVDEPPFRGGA